MPQDPDDVFVSFHLLVDRLTRLGHIGVRPITQRLLTLVLGLVFSSMPAFSHSYEEKEMKHLTIHCTEKGAMLFEFFSRDEVAPEQLLLMADAVMVYNGKIPYPSTPRIICDSF